MQTLINFESELLVSRTVQLHLEEHVVSFNRFTWTIRMFVNVNIMVSVDIEEN